MFWGDPSAAYILNEDGKSPLCLATPDKQIVGLLLLASYGKSLLELSFYVSIKMKRLGIFLDFILSNFLLSPYLILFNLLNN